MKANKRRKLLEQWKAPDKLKKQSLLPEREDNYLDFLATLTGNETILNSEDEEDNRTIEDMVQHYIINAELAHIEIGEKAPSIDLLIVMSEHFGVTIDYLVLGR